MSKDYLPVDLGPQEIRGGDPEPVRDIPRRRAMTTERPLSAASEHDLPRFTAQLDAYNARLRRIEFLLSQQHKAEVAEARATAQAEVARLREALETLTDALDPFVLWSKEDEAAWSPVLEAHAEARGALSQPAEGQE